MIKKITSMMLAATCVVFASCSKDDDDETFTVTVTSADETMGTVTGGGSFAKDAEIVIKAEPKEGFYFFKWDDNNTENPRKVTVTKNMAFIASFKVNGNGGGDGTDDLTESQKLEGSMSENKTLKDLGLPIDYIVDGRFDIEGNACLTIESGVTIAFTGETGMIYVGDDAGLKMIGTEEKPIVFQGPVNNLNKGSWGYIEYRSKRADNQMKYVVMKNGGSRSAVLYLNDAKISIDNCTIDGALENGIEAGDAEITSFTNNTVKNCAEAPVKVGHLNDFAKFGDGNKYEDNGNNVLMITGRTYIEDIKGKKFTLKAQEVPYYFESDIVLDNASELTVEPGVSMLMNADSYIEIHSSSVLTMEGTDEKPITMTSASDKQYHRGIWINNEAIASIKNVKISKAKEDQAIWIDSYYTNVELENVEISDCRDYGIWFVNERDENMSFSQSNVTFKNCAKGNVYHANADEVVDDFAEYYPMPEPAEE